MVVLVTVVAAAEVLLLVVLGVIVLGVQVIDWARLDPSHLVEVVPERTLSRILVALILFMVLRVQVQVLAMVAGMAAVAE